MLAAKSLISENPMVILQLADIKKPA